MEIAMTDFIGMEVGVILIDNSEPLYGIITEINKMGFMIGLHNSDDTVFVPADDISVMQL